MEGGAGEGRREREAEGEREGSYINQHIPHNKLYSSRYR